MKALPRRHVSLRARQPPTPFPDIRALPPALLEQQLDWLQARAPSSTPRSSRPPSASPHCCRQPRAPDIRRRIRRSLSNRVPVAAATRAGGNLLPVRDRGRPVPRLLAVHKTHFLLARLGAAAFGRAVLEECGAARLHAADRPVFGADRWEDRASGPSSSCSTTSCRSTSRACARTRSSRATSGLPRLCRELYLSASMVREMAQAGMAFGYHTRSHRMLARLLRANSGENADGVEWIRGLTGQRAVPFCYPWGGRAPTRRRRCGSFATPAIRSRSIPCAASSDSTRPRVRVAARRHARSAALHHGGRAGAGAARILRRGRMTDEPTRDA